jgi:hypothetical protein
VVDFNHGERLIDAVALAHYVRMDFERSPGGLDLAAVETEKVAGTLHYFLGGERMGWDEVLEYVRSGAGTCRAIQDSGFEIHVGTHQEVGAMDTEGHGGSGG